MNLEEAVESIFKNKPDIGRRLLRKRLAELGFVVSDMEARFLCKNTKDTGEETVEIDDETLVQLIQRKGYFVTKKAKQQNYHFSPNIVPYSGNIYKLGIVSDTHLGSKYQQLSHLITFYELCSKEGIKTVLHCGDILDGEKIYRGHEYELFIHGADGQVEYVIDNYPQYDDISTYFICGTHEESFWKHSGIDVGIRISEKRKDMHHLGFHGAFLELEEIEKLLYLHHGSGGVSYARSYKLQKMIEQMGDELKPHFLLEGHFHVSCILNGYRNVFAIQMPCFQAQTPYLLPKGLFPEIGGIILEFTINEENTPVSPKVQTIMFDKIIKEDF